MDSKTTKQTSVPTEYINVKVEYKPNNVKFEVKPKPAEAVDPKVTRADKAVDDREKELDMEAIVSMAIGKRNEIERMVEEIRKKCDSYNTTVGVIVQMALASNYPHVNDLTQSIIPSIEPSVKISNHLDDFEMVGDAPQ